MQVLLSEKEIEDVLTMHPSLIEEGLTLLQRQGQLENRRFDLLFTDVKGRILLVELKKGIVIEEDVAQIVDYMKKMSVLQTEKIRGMLIGQSIPTSIKQLCGLHQIECKEITTEDIYTYLQNFDDNGLQRTFFENKLPTASHYQTINFHEYMQATASPFGGPYTTYQFFKPKDASPYLSESKTENRSCADEFIQRILGLHFHKELFNSQIKLKRKSACEPRWSVTAGGAWQGYIVDYLLRTKADQPPIPCEIYMGTIGHRGNPRAVYDDEKSRFIQLRVGKGKQSVTTQYGFHKYLKTEERSLIPYYEIKLPTSIPMENREEIYNKLSYYGYTIKSSEDKKSQLLWIGDVSLKDEIVDEGIENLIEALFAITIVKSHVMENGRGIMFDFLE